jgi:hypothetical protein
LDQKIEFFRHKLQPKWTFVKSTPGFGVSHMSFLVAGAGVALELVVAAQGLGVAEVAQAAADRRVLQKCSKLFRNKI